MESISRLESAPCQHSTPLSHTKLFGLDLVKTDVVLATFDSDHKAPYLIDQLPYDKLYELLADLAPTLVAMESVQRPLRERIRTPAQPTAKKP